MRTTRVDLTGQKFGRLTATKFVGTNQENRALWECQCKCGNKVVIPSNSLRRGFTRSCGCLRLEVAAINGERTGKLNTTHGHTQSRKASPEYNAYTSAKKRTTNLTHPDWPNYGGRGIKFLFDSFEEFYNEIGPRPESMSLDRINNDGNYEPGNVRWATKREQELNKRRKAA